MGFLCEKKASVFPLYPIAQTDEEYRRLLSHVGSYQYLLEIPAAPLRPSACRRPQWPVFLLAFSWGTSCLSPLFYFSENAASAVDCEHSHISKYNRVHTLLHHGYCKLFFFPKWFQFSFELHRLYVTLHVENVLKWHIFLTCFTQQKPAILTGLRGLFISTLRLSFIHTCACIHTETRHTDKQGDFWDYFGLR